MKLLLFFSLLVTVYAHGGCAGDCLKACRSCGPLENAGEPGVNNTDVFYYGCKRHGDCKEAICKDPKAVMIVDGEQSRVVCFQGAWHKGYPLYLEQTDSAMCLTPGNHTCDADATLTYLDEFKCVCKGDYKDVTADFPATEEHVQYCSNCANKRMNIILLVDTSGSMDQLFGLITYFAKLLVKFLKVNPAGTPPGNRVSLVTSSFSYEVIINLDEAASELAINEALSALTVDGQSYLGIGMEAVKAAVIQPFNSTDDHKLVVFTDGSVKHSPPAIMDITEAAYNLEALKVETFAVVTNNNHPRQTDAIVNGVEENIFSVGPVEDIMKVVHALQKRICA